VTSGKLPLIRAPSDIIRPEYARTDVPAADTRIFALLMQTRTDVPAQQTFSPNPYGVNFSTAERKTLGSPINPIIRKRWAAIRAHAARVQPCCGRRA